MLNSMTRFPTWCEATPNVLVPVQAAPVNGQAQGVACVASAGFFAPVMTCPMSLMARERLLSLGANDSSPTFMKLKAETRNSTFWRSLILKFFITVRSLFQYNGPPI